MIEGTKNRELMTVNRIIETKMPLEKNNQKLKELQIMSVARMTFCFEKHFSTTGFK
jgi:hypothetical protein